MFPISDLLTHFYRIGNRFTHFLWHRFRSESNILISWNKNQNKCMCWKYRVPLNHFVSRIIRTLTNYCVLLLNEKFVAFALVELGQNAFACASDDVHDRTQQHCALRIENIYMKELKIKSQFGTLARTYRDVCECVCGV